MSIVLLTLRRHIVIIINMNLREIRDKLALSQRDLSSLSGVGAATIARIEQGKQKARPITRRKLAKALGVKPVDIDFS